MKALVLVDLQYDFMPEGALAVAEGNQTVPVANRLIPHFELVVASQDWHPENHGSFVTQHPGKEVGDLVDLNGIQQIVWPVHCVQNSAGAALHADLDRSRIDRVFLKGTDRNIDSYSAFYDNGHLKSTGLGDYLKEQGVGSVTIMGLATDYCVKYSVLDARGLGFDVRLVEDGCRGVELNAGDVQAAIEEMKKAGVAIVNSASYSSSTRIRDRPSSPS
jgi:nicotinamidase/pyrazinamidase